MDSAVKIPNTRTEQLSRFDSPDELQSKANALLGENYKQYSTADKLKIIRLFERPLEEQHASEDESGKLGEIRKRYKKIEGDADALRTQASDMVKASLPSYVPTDLASLKNSEFDSRLPRVTQLAEHAATCFEDLPLPVKLQLYGFSLCRKYSRELNAKNKLATLFESLKETSGGKVCDELGYEYKENFNRKLRTYLPQTQREVLEELESEPEYSVRKFKIVIYLESELAKLEDATVSGTTAHSTSSTTATTTTTTTTTTVTSTDLALINARSLSDERIKEIAADISATVNGLPHILKFCLYLCHVETISYLPFVTDSEHAILIRFRVQLEKETGKFDNQFDKKALTSAVMEKLRAMLPDYLEQELVNNNVLVSHARRSAFESLAASAHSSVHRGIQLSKKIRKNCSHTAILHMIGYCFDFDTDRLDRMTQEEKARFDWQDNTYRLRKDSVFRVHTVRCAFIRETLSQSAEQVQKRFKEALLLLNLEETKKAVLNLITEYFEDPSAIKPPKEKHEVH